VTSRSRLVPCVGCARHVRAIEPACPFCGLAFAGESVAKSPRDVPIASVGVAAILVIGGCSLALAPGCAGSKASAPASGPTHGDEPWSDASTPSEVLGPNRSDSAAGDAAAAAAASDAAQDARDETSHERLAGLDVHAVSDAGPPRARVVPIYGAPPVQWVQPRGPLPGVASGSLSVSASIPDAEATVRDQIMPEAKRCYVRGLKMAPGQAGNLELMARITPHGDVESATVSSNTGLSRDVASCVVALTKRAKFKAPGGSGAAIMIPLTFTAKAP
jgi:hypothetical protein